MNDSEKAPDQGPLLSAVRQIRELGKDARWQKTREERGEVQGLPGVDPGTRAFAQMGMRVEGIARQVLDEMERTDPPEADEPGWATKRDIVVLSSISMPTGIAPPEVTAALTEEAACLGERIEPVTWQLNRIGDQTVLYVAYSYRHEGDEAERIRFLIQLNGETTASGAVC